jgi:hypothetical protein
MNVIKSQLFCSPFQEFARVTGFSSGGWAAGPPKGVALSACKLVKNCFQPIKAAVPISLLF